MIQDSDIPFELNDICIRCAIQVMVIESKYASDCIINPNYTIFLVLMICCKILKSHLVEMIQII